MLESTFTLHYREIIRSLYEGFHTLYNCSENGKILQYNDICFNFLSLFYILKLGIKNTKCYNYDCIMDILAKMILFFLYFCALCTLKQQIHVGTTYHGRQSF